MFLINVFCVGSPFATLFAMWRRNPDLIVPIRDRRQHKRILTLKNFRNALIVLAVLFVIISIRSELRGRTAGDYGRIVNGELPPTQEMARKPVDVVNEAAVGDSQSADPFDVNSAAREQYLGVRGQTAPVPLLEPEKPPAAAPQPPTSGEVAIVGDANGVTLVQTTRGERPQLGGGFGRP